MGACCCAVKRDAETSASATLFLDQESSYAETTFRGDIFVTECGHAKYVGRWRKGSERYLGKRRNVWYRKGGKIFWWNGSGQHPRPAWWMGEGGGCYYVDSSNQKSPPGGDCAGEKRNAKTIFAHWIRTEIAVENQSYSHLANLVLTFYFSTATQWKVFRGQGPLPPPILSSGP